MAEWHLYASGPNEKEGSAKYWDGGDTGKENVRNAIQPALDWTETSNIETCLLAWMPIDNINMSLDQDEAKDFGRYFVKQLGKNCMYLEFFLKKETFRV